MLIQKNRNPFLGFLLFILFFANSSYADEEIDCYFLPEQHWLSINLDRIFSSGNILKRTSTFEKAGFKILHHQDTGMKVAKHPLLPGYLVKAYTSSHRTYGMDWAVNRCIGAERIRKLIEKENLTYFTVPEKWIYVVSYPDPVEVILLVRDMKLVSSEESRKVWKNTSKEQLKQLYTILSHGFASCSLPGNIPYTKKGKFACIDTAYPYRKFDLNYVKKFFSSKNREYWDLILREGEKAGLPLPPPEETIEQ